jgi:hypothetical protein
VLEETVDAIATVVERADSLPLTAFEEHELALQLNAKLQELNSVMADAIQATDSVLELNEWTTSTLPVSFCRRASLRHGAQPGLSARACCVRMGCGWRVPAAPAGRRWRARSSSTHAARAPLATAPFSHTTCLC